MLALAALVIVGFVLAFTVGIGAGMGLRRQEAKDDPVCPVCKGPTDDYGASQDRYSRESVGEDAL